jgi:hypothetical protein
MDSKDKRFIRNLKRSIKRAGSKRRRRQLKEDLTENPEEAPYSEPDVGRYRSADFNALDQDATRQRPNKGKKR